MSVQDFDSAGTDIVADNVRVASVLYFASQLEALRAFDVVDRITQQFNQGLLPIGAGGEVADKLRRHIHSGERLVAAERAQLYVRVFGMRGDATGARPDEPASETAGEPSGEPSGVANREFVADFLAFVSIVAIFQGRAASSASTPVLSEPAVRAAARSLATNVSVHVSRVDASLLSGFERQVASVVGLLDDAEIMQVHGARDMWQVVDSVNSAQLGGSVNSDRYRQRALAGREILQWLATHTEQLRDTAIEATIDASLDQPLRDAALQWIGAGGVPTLFCGARQTGKTMAAHAIAAALSRTVVRVDLKRVVSKFIGETEKNLVAILAQAEQSGALLLLDEAEALFGERTLVADAHDRFDEDERVRCLRCLAAHNGVVILESRTQPRTRWHERLAHVLRFPLA